MNANLYKLPPASRGESHRLLLGAILALAASYFIGASASASRLAYTLGYPPSFGRPYYLPPSSPVLRIAHILPFALVLMVVLAQRRWRYLPLAATACLCIVFLSSYPLYFYFVRLVGCLAFR